MDKDRLRQDYKAKLVLTEQQYNHRIEQTTRRLNQENMARLNAKQHKLDLVRNIINNQDTDLDNARTPATRARAPPGSAARSGGGALSRIYPAQSEPDLSGMIGGESEGLTAMAMAGSRRPGGVMASSARGHTGAGPPSYARPLNRGPRGRSPPPLKPVRTSYSLF